jgi:hypothetical protein
MGRHSTYNQATADKICEAISTSNKGVTHICANIGITATTLFKWLADNKDFAEQYARAREAQADFLADEILEIADDSSRDTKVEMKNGKMVEVEDREWTNRSRLKVDARKWVASKLKPKKYGDKLDLTSGGDKIAPIIIDWTGKTENNE